ncbi:ribosomal protein L36 [Malassezia yamatoensis]|uniref:60S ribosomal protein L36 n=1 Tax=Malassezia yamatoensis TaxID=253288 RepID=A0AAJ5YTR6_9BASI|nr:ribosomal protein L36 [Malassezia yamatoensis]
MGSSSNPAHKAGVPRTGIVWGINRGHPTTRRVLPERRVNKKGVASERVNTIRSIVREVTGFAPYERRAMELIRNSKDKRARKFIKRRVGTMRRAKVYVRPAWCVLTYSKMEILTNVIAEQRRAGH